MKLRDYQEECINNINGMDINDKKIAFLATGAGKTVIMSHVAKTVTGRVLIVVDQFELREQTIDKLSFVIDDMDQVGSVQGKHDDVDKRIVIATRQSLTHSKSNRIDRMLDAGMFDIVMIDECHRAVSQVKKIIDRVGDNARIVGFTATPYNQELTSVFDGFVYEKDVLSLIDEGYLCTPICYRVESDTDISTVKTVGGEFVQGQLSDVVDNNDRNMLIVKAYKDKAINRKHCIVFATSIDHANSLVDCFNTSGIVAKSVDSTLDSLERETVLEEFKDGKFKVLVNVAILTTGFDMEALDTIIMARPTKSKILYTQCIGRGLRLAENKTECLVLDIVDNVSSHSLLNSNSIFEIEDGETVQEAKVRKQREKEERDRLELEEQERQKELERIRLEEINLFNKKELERKQKEIEAFNRDVKNIVKLSDMDWYFNFINGSNVAILSLKGDTDYYVYKVDKVFKVVESITGEGYKTTINDIVECDTLQEVSEEIDNMAFKNGSSYIHKRAKWKYKEATERQKNACSFGIGTTWDAHKFFSKRKCYFALKNII